MDPYSFLSNAEPEALSELYNQYLEDPNSVDEGWKSFFSGFEFAQKHYPQKVEAGSSNISDKEFKVINLIEAYRSRGHLFTETNPVRDRRKYSPDLSIENFGLTEADLNTKFKAGSHCHLGEVTLKEIVSHLQQVYCRSVGVEFVYMREPEKVDWIIKRVHQNANTPSFSAEEKNHILKKMIQATGFESYLHTRFPGQKRFSLEGGEALIPALDTVIEHGAGMGAKEFILGMAHRGRLNVLANIFNKPYHQLFSEFVAKDYLEDGFDGDVKYHLGFDRIEKTDNGHEVKMTLCPNPSHLEAVDPVVEGMARQIIDEKYQGDDNCVVPILIHGDAAVAGQGVVYEVVQMAQLDGYKTGGTVHIVINNQVGFTTNYTDARSSTYCTDIGKVTLSPVFHVNGDDIEAVVHTLKIAMEYRQQFKEDVFIDLLCYRKYGHNEGDEPKFTQPLLYKAIAKHATPRDIYIQQLIQESIITQKEANERIEKFKNKLALEFDESKEIENAFVENFLAEKWTGMDYANDESIWEVGNTKFNKKRLLELSDKLTAEPEGKKLFRKLSKILKDRANMVADNKLDWGMAEMLAYASLLDEGHPIRFSGQDVERGTFSHRHAIVKIEDSEEEYCHLNNLSENQSAKIDIYNSHLSEYGVLGFEYGYSLVNPNGLTVWEAQFGDFFNGAQIMLDQFISAAEDKWKVQSGLVMLLPHGYEGMGAEHSSARIERFLTMSAENNWQLINCTTPANHYHALRRQLKRNYRKPLIAFTPKKLLRYPDCHSSMDDLANGEFQPIINDPNVSDKAAIKTVIVCQGKIYYELKDTISEHGLTDVAVVRMEQLYPTPVDQLESILNEYTNKERVIWAQEEPENMGAQPYMERKLAPLGFSEFIGKGESASPASGSPKRDALRQQTVLSRVFKLEKAELTK